MKDTYKVRVTAVTREPVSTMALLVSTPFQYPPRVGPATLLITELKPAAPSIFPGMSDLEIGSILSLSRSVEYHSKFSFHRNKINEQDSPMFWRGSKTSISELVLLCHLGPG